MLVSGSQDNSIGLWEIRLDQQYMIGDRIGKLKNHSRNITSVALSPDGSTLLSGSYDNSVMIWDINSRNLINTLEEHNDIVYSVAFSPDGNTFASGGSRWTCAFMGY